VVPPFVAQIIEKLLEKSPAKRYQTAAELADELTQHLAAINRTSTDKLDELLGQHAGRGRRWRSVGLRGAVAVAAVLLLAFLAALWVNRRPASEASSQGTRPTAAGGVVVPADVSQAITISVAKTGAADYTTLFEALKRAGPGSTIKILDSGEYTESVFLRDARQHAGITIEGDVAAPPTLVNPQGGDLVRIENVPDVTLRGLKLQQRSDKQHALLIAGAVAGMTVDQVEIVGNSTKYSLVYVRSAAGEPERPVVIRRSRIMGPKMSIVVEAERAQEPVRHVRIAENRFEGGATHVQLIVGVQDAQIQGNVFIGGTGVALGLMNPAISSDIAIENNTFFQNRRWLDLRETVPQIYGISIQNNLILESGGSTIPSKEPLAEFIRTWSLANNHWETVLPNADSAAHGFAEIHARIEVVSRNAEHADFLRPSAALERSETKNTDLPPYVGAFPPAPASNTP
jgi:hypothetical protein